MMDLYTHIMSDGIWYDMIYLQSKLYTPPPYHPLSCQGSTCVLYIPIIENNGESIDISPHPSSYTAAPPPSSSSTPHPLPPIQTSP